MRRLRFGAIFVVCTLVGLAAGTQAAANAAPASALRRYPYLTDLVDKSVTVNWATDRSGTAGSVQWGTVSSGGSCTPSTAVAATRTAISVGTVLEYQWTATITLPSSNPTYCYRPYLGSTNLLGSDPVPQFKAQVPVGSSDSYSFAVFGDWGMTDASGANTDQANVIKQIAASGARFAFTIGDNAYPSGSQSNYGDLQQHGANVSAVFGPTGWPVAGKSIPIFTALGNHGLGRTDSVNPHLIIWPQPHAVASSGGSGQMVNHCCLNGTTSETDPAVWYAFNAGTARFYVLDAAWNSGNLGTGSEYKDEYDYHWHTTSPEYKWLKADLQANPGKLKFAIWHYPLVADSLTESSDPYLSGASSLEGLLAANGVKLGFSGSAHFYERNNPSGTGGLVNYVTGGGGATTETQTGPCSMVDAYAIGWSPTKNAGSACGAATPPSSMSQVHHFLKVTVTGTKVTVTPTDSLGRTFDVHTYDFSQPPPPPPPSLVFSDGFENGNLDLWTTTSGLTVQGAVVHAGTRAARGTTLNGATYAKKTLPGTYVTGYGRVWFNVASASSQVNLIRFRTSTDASIGYLFDAASGQLGFRNDVAGTTIVSATKAPPGSGWHSLELRTTVGSSGTVQVWLDGNSVADLSLTTNLGTTNIGRFQIGEVASGRTYDVTFDDAAFNTTRIGG